MLLTALSIALVVLVVIAGRVFVRRSIVRPLIDRYGPIPWWALFIFIAALIIWRYSQVDSSTAGLLNLAKLITFTTCVLYLIWPRTQN